MAETTSVLAVLAATTAILLGMLRFLSWYARSSNADYQALAKMLEKERAEKLKIAAERDEYKLNAMKYSDQRDEYARYAIHWRDKYKQVTAHPPLIPLPPEQPADASQITKYDLEFMRVEVESDSSSISTQSVTQTKTTTNTP